MYNKNATSAQTQGAEAPKNQVITEKRKLLKDISKGLKNLVVEGEFDNLNQAIIAKVYTDETHKVFKTLKQWNAEGFNVIKGEKAFIVWGKPTKIQKEKNEESKREDNFFPISYLFSNAQVMERRKENV